MSPSFTTWRPALAVLLLVAQAHAATPEPESARMAALSETQFCTKELRKLKGKRSPLPQPWFDALAARARQSGVDGWHLTLIQEGQTGIGMTACGAIAAWGRPESINKTTTARGTREQWVYGGRNYLYFTNGVLDAIQN